MKGLLLAGGSGTRLRPLTFGGNKHMLPIANKPMILFGLEHLVSVGIKEIAVIIGSLKEGVVELLGDGSAWDIQITYIDQPEPKGLAHAVLLAESFLRGDSFVMYLGDNLLKHGAAPLIEKFEHDKCDCVIGVTQVKDPSSYGVVEIDDKKNIKRLVEKPKQFVSSYALVGVYIFNEKIFEVVRKLKPSDRGELEITDAIQLLVNEDAKVGVTFIQGWWKDTGKPEDLLEANQLVLNDLEEDREGLIEKGVNIVGRVSIGNGSIIRSKCSLQGPVIIGKNCEISEGAKIGRYTSIGDGVSIKNSQIENSIIMNDSTIDCRKMIADSIIGRGVKVQNSNNNLHGSTRLILGDAGSVKI